jgi:hypothetical protein
MIIKAGEKCLYKKKLAEHVPEIILISRIETQTSAAKPLNEQLSFVCLRLFIC